MDFADLDKTDKALVERTSLFLKKRASDVSGVSAGLRTNSGREFFGLCIDTKTSTVGVCAEFSAIGNMLSNGEREVRTIVAVADKGNGRHAILPPCGKCRDFIRAFGNPFVILQMGSTMSKAKKVKLSELSPFPWDQADWAGAINRDLTASGMPLNRRPHRT